MPNESTFREDLNRRKLYRIAVSFLSLIILVLIFWGLFYIVEETPTLTHIIELILEKTHSNYLPTWIIFSFSVLLLLCFKFIEFYPEILKRSDIPVPRSHLKNSREIAIWATLLDVGIVFASVRSHISKESWDYLNLTLSIPSEVALKSCEELFLFLIMPYAIMLGISSCWQWASFFSLEIGELTKKSTSVVGRASELGYQYLPKTEKASLGRFVALKIQPDFKEWKGIYRINQYRVTQELDDRIHNYFKRKLEPF